MSIKSDMVKNQKAKLEIAALELNSALQNLTYNVDYQLENRLLKIHP